MTYSEKGCLCCIRITLSGKIRISLYHNDKQKFNGTECIVISSVNARV